ncbi:MAG: hypothetical protein M1828_002771 [Chrysothrix sp. TS-e1954]|nr:MAG: hypothetical protein M1828_002771 [Chrysothrix sp. TS-e1954]
MHPFSLDLPNGSCVTGRSSQDPNASPSQTNPTDAVPLLVCVHGGSFDARYFDATPELSVERVTSLFDIPVVSIDRPSYGQTTPIPTLTADQTFIQETAKRFHNDILPSVWRKFGGKASSIILWGHSIGTATCIVIAGLHGRSQSDDDAGYPLSGLICSALGTNFKKDMPDLMKNLPQANPDGTWPAEARAALLLKPEIGLSTPESYNAGVEVNPPAPPPEVEDIFRHWHVYWRSYAKDVKVPVLYAVAEHDCFGPGWSLKDPENSESQIVDCLREFAGAFENSPAVTGGQVLRAPHNIEMSKQGKAWSIRCCGFALECAFAHETKSLELHG